MGTRRVLNFKTKLPSTCAFVELTPLVDVIFLLLVFFIITSDIFPLKSVNVDTPRLEQKTAPMMSPLLLTVDSHYRIFVGPERERVQFDRLGLSLEKQISKIHRIAPGKVPVIILSLDQRVDYGFFLGIFSVAQQYASKVRLVYKEERGDLPC